MERGQLRIYLGAAPGVGKTYEMLAEAQRRRARGTDVVAALVETHGRRLTTAMAEGLETVPRRTMAYRGSTFSEMDLDAVLARHPQVALVDELAHTNVPGCRNAKRWQDVNELLGAGIDVVTTLNIQHLESLNDVARQITGVEQQETLPDAVARAAEQIELVDMTPEALRRRMVHGNVYPPNRIEAALTHYFRPGNLTALRELALLWVADRVEEGMRRYRQEHGIATPWETRERIIVCLAGDDGDEPVIRRAARIAARTPASELIAVHVRTEDSLRDNGILVGAATGLETQRALVTSLGGSFYQIPGEDVARSLLQFASAENATQIVLGASRRGRLLTLVAGKSTPTRLARKAQHMDVHLVSRQAGRDRRARVLTALRSRRTSAARATAEAAALTRLAGCVLSGRGEPPALLEEMREMFGLQALSLLEHPREDTGWYVAASAGPEPPERPGDPVAEVELAISDTFLLAGRGRTLTAAEARTLFSCAVQVVASLTRRRGEPEDAADLRSRTALLAAIGQNARQQLGAIRVALAGLDGLTKRDPAAQNGDRALLLAALRQAVGRLDRLVADLGDLVRLHAGAIETFLRPVDLDEIVAAALDDLGPGGPHIMLNTAEDLPDVIADASLLTRMLTSLLADAQQRSQDGPAPVLSAAAVAGHVQIRVVDAGPAPKPGTPNGGFALKLARDLTEAMGDTIHCERGPGGGRSVVIELPAAAPRPRARATA